MITLIPVLLLCTVSVVEISLAREIIYRCGRGARREPNHLVVFSELTTGSLYVRADDISVTEVARLYVDEGRYEGCLNPSLLNGSGLSPAFNPNRAWEELIDATDLARLVCDAVAPDHVYKDTGLIGRGSHKRGMQAQYLEVMRANLDMLKAMGFKVEETLNPV